LFPFLGSESFLQCVVEAVAERDADPKLPAELRENTRVKHRPDRSHIGVFLLLQASDGFALQQRSIARADAAIEKDDGVSRTMSGGRFTGQRFVAELARRKTRAGARFIRRR